MTEAAELFEAWPKVVNAALIEPATGIVRVCRRGLKPIELEPTATRELAVAAGDIRDQVVLFAAAAEAERQESQLTGVMEDPWID